MEDFVGEIRMFAGKYVPQGWLLCNGAEYPIQGKEALYSVIGTRYGGNDGSTFRVPNIVVAAMGQNPYEGFTLGKTVGDHLVTLQANHIPLHSHAVTGKLAVSTLDANKNDPTGNYYAVTKTTDKEYATASASGAYMAADMLEVTIGDVTKDPKRQERLTDYLLPNFQPYLCVNYIICVEGTYPRRP